MFAMAANRNEEMRLLQALNASEGLKVLGCRFARGLTGGVCMLVSGHALGAWYATNNGFRFSRIAHLRPERTATDIKDVVAQTAAMAVSRRAVDEQSRAPG